MLYLIFYPLKDIWVGFNLFRYITFRAFCGSALAIIIVLLLGKKTINYLKNKNFIQPIKEFMPQEHLKKNIPTMGGILIVKASLISFLLFADITNRYIILGIIFFIAFAVLGFFDDYYKIKRKKGLDIKTKLISQSIIIFLLLLLLYFWAENEKLRGVTQVLFFKNILLNFHSFYLIIAFIFMLVVSNGINFTDGLDGLAAGLIAICSGVYAVLSYCGGNFKIANYLNLLYIKEVGELSIFALILMGACLGFLWFNAHPAEIFMGDVGSLPLGMMLGYLALASKQEILFIFAGGIFLLEFLSVFLQVIYFRLTKGKRIFFMAPLHHHYEIKGEKEEKIVVRFWIIGVLLGIITLASLKIR
ncbi:MAG: phospho-N-acetylmuramoyl-pentapeptide-transferase [candidate division WOR-3 bacterium]